MVWNLLADNTGNSGTLMIILLAVVLIVFMFISRRSQKKRQEETVKMLDAIKPGNKVKTIGGVCGVVVEICNDNTFILETGSESTGKSYIKFDKQAVYQTDAVVDKTVKETKAVEEKPVEEVAPVEEPFAEAEADNAQEEKAE